MVRLINQRKSPIQDEYIEKYLAGKELDLTATLDAKEAYRAADFVVIAVPANYDSECCSPCGFGNCDWLYRVNHCGVDYEEKQMVGVFPLSGKVCEDQINEG